MQLVSIGFVVCLFLNSCTIPMVRSGGDDSLQGSDKNLTTIRIINWNVQTFFDGETTGTEYSDYKGSKTQWSEDRYKERLKILCTFIEETDADVYVFQEIENSAILQDISNQLVGMKAAGKGFAYSCFAKDPTTALGTAVLSRYPLQGASVHQIDLRSALDFPQRIGGETIQDGTILQQPSLRGILQVDVLLNEDDGTQDDMPEKRLALYVCHWKSKYGGAEKSEVWRNAQERLLADLLLAETSDFLVCGDFNRTLEEFLLDGSMDDTENDFSSQNIQANLALQGTSQDAQVVSPWLVFKNETVQSGSYYYRESWEKIDHFFYNTALNVLDFQTLHTGSHVLEGGFPLRYDIWKGSGVSDHLPLLCILEI